MKTRDGENLGGRAKAEDDFKHITFDDDEYSDFDGLEPVDDSDFPF